MAELRKFGVKQVCPLCRTPLPPGPEQLCIEAAWRYMWVVQLVARGGASWSALPLNAQLALDKAVTQLRTAAKEECAEAQRGLGLLYKDGHGVTQSDEEAARWFEKAAGLGDAVAQYNLGLLYRGGCGVNQDIEKAVWLFKNAAEQGNAEAQRRLAMMLELGRGVEQSYVEAVRWCRKAADQGLESAQYDLGCFYEEGHGVVQSDVEAAQWFMKAAEQGYPGAQWSLGRFYEEGRSVPQSYVEASQWQGRRQVRFHGPGNLNLQVFLADLELNLNRPNLGNFEIILEPKPT